MVRKDDCLNCDDAVWEVNGEPWYHPNTGMRACATSRGGVATPKTSDAEWLRRANPSIGVAVSDNAIRRAMATDPVDLPGFPRPVAEYGKGRCLEGSRCEDESCVKAGHPGVVPVEYLSAREREAVKLEPLVIAATEQFIDDSKWDAATENDTTTHHTLTLNMDNPTDRAFYELSNVIRSKRSDYAEDDDPWSNFRDMANLFGGYPWDAANVLEMCKLSRLKALTSNGREPANESVLDSHRDKAAYALLAFAMLLDEGSTWEGTK